jgi:hypothetical protein
MVCIGYLRLLINSETPAGQIVFFDGAWHQSFKKNYRFNHLFFFKWNRKDNKPENIQDSFSLFFGIFPGTGIFLVLCRSEKGAQGDIIIRVMGIDN